MAVKLELPPSRWWMKAGDKVAVKGPVTVSGGKLYRAGSVLTVEHVFDALGSLVLIDSHGRRCRNVEPEYIEQEPEQPPVEPRRMSVLAMVGLWLCGVAVGMGIEAVIYTEILNG